MTEIWLRTNRRALGLGLALCVLLTALGAVLFWIGYQSFWLRISAVGLSILGLAGAALFIRKMVRPRIAYRGSDLMFHMNAGPPLGVPIEHVECFFFAQSDSSLPGATDDSKVATVAVRLAEKAGEWHKRDVKPALGKWEDGYITVRGTWCEPISLEVVGRLNAKLRRAKNECTSECTSTPGENNRADTCAH